MDRIMRAASSIISRIDREIGTIWYVVAWILD